MSEQLTNPELLNPVEADSYVIAACQVLSQPASQHEGIGVTELYKDESRSTLSFARLTLETDDGVTYEVGMTDDTSGKSLLVSRKSTDIEGDLLHTSVTRSGDVNSRRNRFRLTETVPGQDKLEISNDQQKAKDALATIGGDFKMSLQQKLSDRPELIDMIAWTQEDVTAKQRRSRLGKLAGRVAFK